MRSAERLVNGLRSFLRFALVEELITAPLADAVPSVARPERHRADARPCSRQVTDTTPKRGTTTINNQTRKSPNDRSEGAMSGWRPSDDVEQKRQVTEAIRLPAWP